MTRIIMLNGPRQVGKDFIANRLIEAMDNSRKLPIAWPMKVAAVQACGLPASSVHTFEENKDIPFGVLKGLTPREMYIKYGDHTRGLMGDDVFANAWSFNARSLTGADNIFVPDVRFQCEVDEAVRTFGAHNVVVIRVHRRYYDWKRDIGSYVKHWNCVDVDNSDEDENVADNVYDYIEGHML